MVNHAVCFLAFPRSLSDRESEKKYLCESFSLSTSVLNSASTDGRPVISRPEKQNTLRGWQPVRITEEQGENESAGLISKKQTGETPEKISVKYSEQQEKKPSGRDLSKSPR